MAASVVDEKRAERDSVDGSTKASLKINSEADADKINEKSVVGASGAGESDAAVPQKENANADEEVDAVDDEELEEVDYPSTPKLALLTLGLALVIFVIALDNTIIATAIPTITTVFDSLGDVGWYGSSYLLTTTSLQPSFGKIYQYFNVKWTYLGALIIFEVGSVICAAATSSPMLIIGRAVAGAGASALFSGGMTIIGFSVPLDKRPIYLASLSSMFGIASVVGPIMGGALTDRVSWRWCFYINLPFGAVAFLAVAAFFKPPKRKSSHLSFKQKIGKIDILGAIFLICAIVCLLLALQWGGTTFPWHSSRIWGLFLGFGLIIIVFIGVQFYRGDDATIPARIFLRQRTVFCGSLFACLIGMGLYTHIYYLPFYFQAVKGVTAEQSGIRSIPYLVSITVSSIIVGAIITKVGYYVPALWFGASIFAVGSGLLFTLSVSTASAKWIGYQILTGFGAGSALQIPFLAVQVVLNSKDMPIGNAVVIFFNTLGGAISISIAQNVFSNELLSAVRRDAPGVDPNVVAGAGATNLRNVISSSDLPNVLVAYTYAITRAFILPIAVAAMALVISFGMEWRSMKEKKGKLMHAAVA